MRMLLEVRELKVIYGKAEALKEVSLGVAENEVVALIGANGAGKTTTLRAISGLVAPASGEIWFMGKRVERIRAHERVRLGIGHIPEGRRVFSALSVEKNLEVGAYTCRDRRKIASEIQKIYHAFPILKERRNQLAGTLSGGEQQMLAIGRCLMNMPNLILMDEPSLGLSPLIVQQVANIIKVISQGGTSILLVEQNALMALHLAARGYVLEVGSVVMEGKAQDLLYDRRLKEAYLGM